MTDATEDAKRRAAVASIDAVASHTVIGLGTGSTMRYAIEELGRRLAAGRLRDVSAVPTSVATARLAEAAGIPLVALQRGRLLELAIDGADEIDGALDLIKGRGGALLREKIVAASARELLVVADETKLVTRLGSRSTLPLEVIPFALPLVLDRLARMPGQAQERVASAGSSFRTDEGNAIIDYTTGPIDDPGRLDHDLLAIPGVVDHGLFLGMATRALVSRGDELSYLTPA